MTLFTTTSFIDNTILSEKVYVAIPIKVEEGISSLHNLTIIEADKLFGKKNVKQAILNYTKVEIPKVILLERLKKANLFNDAMSLLHSSDAKSSTPSYNYEIFNATPTFYSNDRMLRIFLKRIKGDLDILLAPIE